MKKKNDHRKNKIKNHFFKMEEEQYLQIVRNVLETGVLREDRTGVGTLSIFGTSMRFNLRNNVFPLLTTKRVFWKGIVEELLWFLHGSTDSSLLSKKGVRIWDKNGSREFLDSRELFHYEEGDLGPIYGFQWRHWGAEYVNKDTCYENKGIDQIAEVIKTIKENPSDRRMIVSAWNPSDLKEMALPPCHLLFQFYVARGELSCQMYQRSADLGLGVPFNIASYSLLTRIIADVCNLQPGDFIHVLGDTHIYCNHVEALKEQCQRTPSSFPTLIINKKTCIDDYVADDFILENYNPQSSIQMSQAV